MLTLVAFVVVFGTIVFFHELGHFTVAKLAGIQVYEFAIGFGPALGSFTRGETKYSFRAFPLGGFVRMAGMDEGSDAVNDVEEDNPRSFHNKNLGWRLGTIAAGPLMNFVLAIVLFVIYFMLIAVPPTITLVEMESPGQIAGFLPGDSFVSINGETVNTTDEVIERIKASPNQEMTVVVKRERQLVTVQVVPQDRDGIGVIGIAIDSKPQYPFLVSLRAGVSQTWYITTQLVRDLSRMLTGKQKAEISGPIGIVQIVGQTAKQGLPQLLILAIILNINLGLLNLLPVPVLDGGWLVILVVEAIRGKPLAPEARGIAQFIGLALLVLLMLFATFKDISNLNLFS
ncbi:MAG: RIP metalloprotease RseP [Firmicutes bacterium]|nr:RIP metalloprotease RseP [Bacillota bacterium]